MLSMNDDHKATILALTLTSACVLAVVLGWRTFYFTTDDAYITFRYVSNSVSGYGFVWNPAPFKPVEGYTSFLWALVLRVVWSLTGLQPPQVANVLSLLFGIMTLFIVYRFMGEMVLPGMSARLRIVSGAIVFAGILGNRTYLTWLSSGLETSLYNLLITLWIYLVFSVSIEGRERPLRIFHLSLCSALTYLCRPEGILVALGTVVIALIYRVSTAPDNRNKVWQYSPLFLIPVHLFWRRMFYGYWLPNTYYAKVDAAWPESGYRYLLSFVIEYGIWFWCLILLVSLLRRARAPGGFGNRISSRQAMRLVVMGVLFITLSYYTFIVGGDHFEYRIYSYLIPLLFISSLYLLSTVLPRGQLVPPVLLILVLVSLPIPWTHWYQTRDLGTRTETFMLIRPIASLFPSFFRPPISLWDQYQEWLISHHVCMRHQEHKVASEYFASILPSRDDGSVIRWQERAVMQENAVGVLGWVLPEVAIIDRMGLNDLVIARTPLSIRNQGTRMMAHDRLPPPGYVECFRPNVSLGDLGLTVAYRPDPLTDAEIMSCEERFLSQVTQH